MAGGKVKLDSKAKASSILEVVISMVVIVVIFSIAMMIFNNVFRMSLSVKKIKAQAILQEILIQTEQSTEVNNQSINKDDFTITLETSPWNNDEKLTMIHLTAFDANKQTVAELRKVILKK